METRMLKYANKHYHTILTRSYLITARRWIPLVDHYSLDPTPVQRIWPRDLAV